MDRRSALRAIGVSAGSLAIGTPHVSFETAAKGEESNIVNSSKKFLELRIEVTNTGPDGSAAKGCRQWPSFNVGNNRVYLSEYGSERVDVSDDQVVWATYNGIIGTQNQDELPLQSVPYEADTYGSARLSAEKDLPAVSVNVEEQSAEVRVGDEHVEVGRNSDTEQSRRIEITDSDGNSESVTASIYVAYHGMQNLVGHEKLLLLPKNPDVSNAMRTLEEKAGKADASNQRSIRVTEYEAIDAYAVEHGIINGGN